MPLKSVSEIAEFTGKARETVTKAVKAAGMTPVIEGRAHKYESREVVPLLFDALNPDELDLSKERARLAHHQANKTQLEEDTLRSRLVPIEDVATNWQEMIAAARGKLLALPQRIAQVAVAGATIREVEGSARNEIYGALAELGGGAAAGDADLGSAAQADGGGVGRSRKVSEPGGKRGARKVAKPKSAAHGQTDGGAKSV